jgi:hypothetical protein
MNEDNRDAAGTALENRSRALFHDSVDGVDMAIRSRLTQARYAALEASAASSRRPWFLRMPVRTPAAGVAAAALLGVALWFGTPGNHGAPGVQSNLEVLDMVASSDGSGDALEMLQDDIDFYDFADKAASSEPAA